MTELATLCNRSYETYLSRLKASQRLAFRNRLWNASLVALSTALVLGSIGMLVDHKMYGAKGSVMLVALAIMQLSSSLVVSGLNYGGRSRDMFTNYRRMQKLSVEAENLNRESKPSRASVRALSEQYQMLLDESENHTAADYFKAFKLKKHKAHQLPGVLLSVIPVLFLSISLLIVIPFISWVIRG